MFKVEIDKEGCIGCGTCVGLCGEVFELGDEGKAHIIEDYRSGGSFEGEVPEDMDCVHTAEENCPTDAILVE